MYGWANWVSANIMLPVMAPLILVGLVYVLADAKHKRRFAPFLLVKDGQLAWAALLFTTSAMYEREDALMLGKPASGFVLLCLVASLLVSCVIPLLGLIFPTSLLSVRLKTSARLAHYKVFAGSAVAAAFSAICYSGVHFGWLN